MKALITGSKGFIGSYLYTYLGKQGHRVFGDRREIYGFDIRDERAVRDLVTALRPDWVFHLAAQSYPGISFRFPHITLETNILGTLNLLEALRVYRPAARIVLACSSAEYGGGDHIDEGDPLDPVSPYGVTKLAAEKLGYCYYLSSNLHIIIARIFGTTGPGKKGDVVADFAHRIAEGEDPITVGRLDTVRDITDVRDVIRALVVLAETGQPGEAYNICSGQHYVISDILRKMLALAGREWSISVHRALLRPTDEDVIVGNNSKIRALGWQPKIPIEQTLKDTLEWWRISSDTYLYP